MKLPYDMYRVNRDNTITCLLCPHNCTLKTGEIGACGNRKAVTNKQGELVMVFRRVEQIEAVNLDPIEKKPLYHFCPGGDVLSLGLTGCNMRCYYCQNYTLSQELVPEYFMLPEEIDDTVINKVMHQLDEGSPKKPDKDLIGFSFTYSEPTTWFEFLYPLANRAKELGYKNTLVSNGMMSAMTADKLLPLIDGVNFDVKAYSQEAYERLGGNFQTVKQIVEKFVSYGVHTELTYLVVPDFNDDDQIRQFVEWVASLSKDIPVHFSRYFPSYRAHSAPTSEETLYSCYNLANQYLNYVYLGNFGDASYQTTYCWNCQEIVIERYMFTVKNNLINDKCPYCNSGITGVFN